MSEFKNRLEKTRKRLLDLTKRNKLINYHRPNKSRNLKIIDKPLEFIYQRLVVKEKEFRFKSIPEPKMTPQYLELQERLKLKKEEYFRIDERFENIRWFDKKEPLIFDFTLYFKEHTQNKKRLQDEIVELTKEMERLNPPIEEQAKGLGFNISNQMPKVDLGNESIDKRYIDGYLQTLHYPTQLEKILKKIELDSRSIIEESGSNMLYLVLGILEWSEKKSPDKLKSPLFTIPVSLKRGKLNRDTNCYDYILSYTGDAIDTNSSLGEKLKSDFNMGFPDITEDSSFGEYMAQIEEICKIREGWRVRDEISLDFLQFGKILMYKDLDTDNWVDNSLENNRVLQELFLGRENQKTSYSTIDYDIDSHKIANSIPLVLDADSSQHSAIVDVIEGKNVVIEGPPGTGKSQTISNMIASLMAEDKSVLFVSEKLAALEVVYKRLSDVGLGDLCLELHSHKSQKTEVLRGIKRRLEQEYTSSTQRNSLKYRVESKKKELKEHLEILHKEYGDSGKTLFEIFWLVEKYRYTEKYLKFEFQEPKSLTTEDIESRKEGLLKFIDFYKNYDFENFYWIGFSTHNLSFIDIDEFIELLKKVQQEYMVIDELFRLFGFKIDDEYNELKAVSLFCKTAMFDENLYDIELLKNLKFDSKRLNEYLDRYKDFTKKLNFDTDNIDELIEYSNSLVKIVKDISNSADNEIVSYKQSIDKSKKRVDEYKRVYESVSKKLYLPMVNHRSLKDIIEIEQIIEDKKDSFFNFLSSKYKRAKRRFESLLLKRLPKDKSTWMYLFRDIKEYLSNKKIIDELKESTKEFIQKIDLINLTIEETLKLYQHIENSQLDTNIKSMLLKDFRQKKILDDIALGYNRLDSIYMKLYNYGEIDNSFWGESPIKITKCIEKLNHIEEEKSNLSLWSDFSKISNQLKSLGMEQIVKSVERGDLPIDEVIANFEYNLHHSLLILAFREYPIFNDFSRLNHEKAIKSFIKADKKLLELNQQYIAFKASKRAIPPSKGKGSVKSFTNLKLLEHEISKKRRHIPIRQLIKRAGGAIQALKPCFMMSPLSVAQYLPPNLLHFDVLLIDEASQLRPEEALGAIARAKQIVIVGDPKQLPPTSFFDSFKEDDGSENDKTIIDESESILDSCIDLYSPARRLKWHYRSQHESLIDFSNQQFYDNDLIVFPSPSSLDSEELGVKHHYIADGIYQSGAKRRFNQIEAKVVVEHIQKQMEQFPNKSLGVGTFNVTQRDIILQMIDDIEKINPQVANYISKWQETSEPFFIKNLESLQGDERDVIFISTTYGKDKITGRVMQRFGPINQDVGWRRLNVLVTRAKQKMSVFTSLQSSDIITSNSSSKGLIAFKSFLHYLETGRVVERGIETNRGFDSPFEESVYKLLQSKGIKSVPQVGVSGYFIDLAVVSPQNGDYILAIECDGASYHSSKSARDRDRLKDEVLKRLGWEVYRIWSVGWYKNRESEVEKLLEMVDEVKRI